MGLNKWTVWGLIMVFTLGMLFLVFENGSAQRMPKGDGLMSGTLQKMPKTGINPVDLPEADSERAKVYTKYCAQCHVLPSPTMHSGREWWVVVERMVFRMWIVQKIMSDDEWSRKAASKNKWEGSGMLKYQSEMKKELKETFKSPTEDEKLKIIHYLDKHGLAMFAAKEFEGYKSKEINTFKKVCSRCHDLPNPKLFNASEWSEIIARQRINMEELETTLMSQEEEKEILKFLQDNAAKS